MRVEAAHIVSPSVVTNELRERLAAVLPPGWTLVDVNDVPNQGDGDRIEIKIEDFADLRVLDVPTWWDDDNIVDRAYEMTLHPYDNLNPQRPTAS